MRQNNRADQSGNALFMVLIGVVLFAALAFTFTKGSQQGGENISIRQAELATSDIVTFAQRTSRAVDGILRSGKSESMISFEGLNGTYTNAACPDNTCKVFTGGGGGIQPVYPLSNWLDANFSASYAYGTWFATAKFCVPGLGDAACSAPSGNELVIVLPYVKKSLCVVINEKLGITNPPPAPATFGGITPGTKFDGSFTPTGGAALWAAAGLNEETSACLYDSVTKAYYFYQVLVTR